MKARTERAGANTETNQPNPTKRRKGSPGTRIYRKQTQHLADTNRANNIVRGKVIQMKESTRIKRTKSKDAENNRNRTTTRENQADEEKERGSSGESRRSRPNGTEKNRD
ncbi:hypothetical protein CPC08DRAFT_708563 [Agrocybe pediades]|nr:hypothetical protein CPC08DRAFT_708563 [Agrocybe pediades]